MRRPVNNILHFSLRRSVLIILVIGATVSLLILFDLKADENFRNRDRFVPYELADIIKDFDSNRKINISTTRKDLLVVKDDSSEKGHVITSKESITTEVPTKPVENLENLSWTEFLSTYIPKLPNNNGYKSPPSSMLSICSPEVVRNLSKGLSTEDLAFCQWALKSGGVQVISQY